MIFDRFMPRIQELRDLSLAEVTKLVETETPELVAQEPVVMERHGVGGFWTVIELRPGTAPRATEHAWGPMWVRQQDEMTPEAKQPTSAP
jgi:hypothetical protein